MSNKNDTEDKATDAPDAAANTVGTRGRRWWRWAALVVAVAAIGYVIVPKLIPVDVDDGFIAFDPDAALFPAAPVDNASTLVGIGSPSSLRDGLNGCPYKTERRFESRFGNDWHTVRHDWEEGGTAKAWVISERTTGFEDLDEYDDYMEENYLRTKYCGWTYDSSGDDGFTSVLTELDGLPDGAFAFTSQASPWNRGFPERYGNSNPDEFDALTAVIPGPKRGQLMWYTWLGWAADVPREAFVANANTMYQAARDTPDPVEPSADADDVEEATSNFVPFQFPELDPLPILGRHPDGKVVDGPFSEKCLRNQGSAFLEISDEGWQGSDAVVNDDRSVGVATARFSGRAAYLDAKRAVISSYTPTCIDSVQDGRLLIEPMTVPGVPGAARVAVWHEFGDYVGVMFDDDRRLIMVMAWNERNGDVPVDDFAEVFSSAWTQFQADNS